VEADASIKLLSTSSATVESGTDSGTSFAEISDTRDTSNSLYSATTVVATATVSGLADGIYEAYTTTGDRIDDVQNTAGGEGQISAWIRFTMAGGVPNLPPVFSRPSLYQTIAPNGTVTADFRATDPEGGSVTYTYLTDTTEPIYAGTAIPCSRFAAGVLTIGPAHCSGGDVFADIFDADNPDYNDEIPSWVAKVEAKDAAGNTATSDVLFRLMSAPEPFIDDDVWIGGTDYELEIYANDTSTDLFSVECVNDADVTDVVSASGASSPLTVRNLTIGADYTCTPYAENAAGNNYGDTYGLGPITGLMLDLNLSVGVEFSGATSDIVGGGLKANSAFALTMYSDPILIYAGTTDGSGNFTQEITIPAEACIPGIHHLILSGVDPSNTPVQDEQWVEIGNNCEVLRWADEELAETGFDATPGIIAGSVLAVVGVALAAYRRRTRLS
jgi:hypothetical protein